MSLLLDALHKADQERNRDQANSDSSHPLLHANPQGARRLSRVTLVLIALAITLLLSAMLVAGRAYWVNQNTTSAAPAAIATTATAPTFSAAHTTASSSAPAVIHTETELEKNHAEAKFEIKKVDAETETNTETINAEQEDLALAQDVAGLYEKNAHAEAIALLAAANSLATENNSAALDNNRESFDDNSVALDNNSALLDNNKSAAAPVSIAQFANLPDLHDLPVELLAQIPSLNYSEHHYHPSGGYVKINGEVKHADEQLAPELVIDKILEDGMILHFNNYSFKMRALNSWVNM